MYLGLIVPRQLQVPRLHEADKSLMYNIGAQPNSIWQPFLAVQSLEKAVDCILLVDSVPHMLEHSPPAIITFVKKKIAT